jgi:uncharacterized protein
VRRDAPGIRVSVASEDGKSSAEPLDLQGRVISFSFEDSESKADKVTLELDNTDLSLFDREDLTSGTVLEVSWGYRGDMAPPRRVVIKDPKGFQKFRIEGIAESVLLDGKAQTRAFSEKTRSEVAAAVAKEHGYLAGAVFIEDTTERIDTINQTGESDARFVRRLAEKEGFSFFIDDTGFHFHERKQDSSPAHVLTWRMDRGAGDILSVTDVKLSSTKPRGSVTVKGRDPIEKKTIEKKETNDTADRDVLSDVIDVVDPETGNTTRKTRAAKTEVSSTTATTEAGAAREARTGFVKAERKTLSMSVSVVGNPKLRAKSIIELRGLPALLAGKYAVTQATHSIGGSGYTTALKLSRDGLKKTAKRPGAADTGGKKNEKETKEKNELTEFERVDPESGETVTEYRKDGA